MGCCFFVHRAADLAMRVIYCNSKHVIEAGLRGLVLGVGAYLD